jgi:hypothetical protein
MSNCKIMNSCRILILYHVVLPCCIVFYRCVSYWFFKKSDTIWLKYEFKTVPDKCVMLPSDRALLSHGRHKFRTALGSTKAFTGVRSDGFLSDNGDSLLTPIRFFLAGFFHRDGNITCGSMDLFRFEQWTSRAQSGHPMGREGYGFGVRPIRPSQNSYICI